MGTPIALRTVDAVEVALLVDNAVDILLTGAPGVARWPMAYDWSAGEQLIAEHGYSALVTVIDGGSRSSVLYDAGLSRGGLSHNLDVMGLAAPDLRAITISHGHADHHGGLEGLVRLHGIGRLPLIIHPDAWKDRRVVFPTGAASHLPPPSRNDLEREGLEVIDEIGPTLLVDGRLLISGQVERTTDYERGMPIQQARVRPGEGDDAWAPDPLTFDDQNVIVNVRGLGLVVISACSHSGSVNVLRNAQRLTGESRIAGFVGGLHLTGGLFEPIIPATIAAFAELGVARVVPGHCTGWRATMELARVLPEAFVPSSVGTTLRFAAA